MNRIILASQSPRRAELLSKLGVNFETIPSNFEEHLDESKTPQAVAKELAFGKALDVARKNPDAYVIGSDTVVALGIRQMEKPIDLNDAREMLTCLAGKDSIVTTGLAVVCIDKGIELLDEVTVHVFFKPNSDEIHELREAYLATGDWKDKAAGYGIQSGAGPLIDRIDGEYDAIVGLPTDLLRVMLSKLNLL
ncbi:septum formation protein Maf [Aeromicrobium sp.]|nr:septum formation protein Maf [Candidatus Saccharibacteria bacterium]